MSMTNFRFLSRVQPALIQRQCKREERKESEHDELSFSFPRSEHDELSFSFPSAACSYPKNQQLVIVLPEGSEELPIRIVRGSRARGEASMLIQAQGYARTDCKLTNYDVPLPQHRAHTSAVSSAPV